MTSDPQAMVTEKFSELLWGLCLALSFEPLLNFLQTEPEPRAVFVRTCCSALVFFTILRNYLVNRKLMFCFHDIYHSRGPAYGGVFDWLLNGYIGAFFGLGVFQYRPLGSALSLVVAGTMGCFVLVYESRTFQGLSDVAGGASDLAKRELLRLYRFWLGFDFGLVVAGVVLALVVAWNWNWFQGEAGLWVFSGVLVVFNAVDLIVNRRFHFARPSVLAAGSEAD